MARASDDNNKQRPRFGQSHDTTRGGSISAARVFVPSLGYGAVRTYDQLSQSTLYNVYCPVDGDR